jgi:hypothetical protein
MPALFVYEPTAVHVVVDAQATAERLELCAPARLGEDWIVQLMPFQLSISVT